MSTTPASVAKRSGRQRLLWLLVSGGIVIFAGANAHLVYVAFTSHPGCVEHLKEVGSGQGEYRAAKSAC